MERRRFDPHSTRSPRVALAAIVPFLTVALIGCDPGPAVTPTLAPTRPSVRIDPTWTANAGQWTFTGEVDPAGSLTDVVLEAGPGPDIARQFPISVPVSQGLAAAGPLTITTSHLPASGEICVRFTATNRVGTSSSSPLCFPHDVPSFVPGAPIVRIDSSWSVANGKWTFSALVDTGGVATDVVLDVGRGPASKPVFERQLTVSKAMTGQATLQFSTSEIPNVTEVCVRFTATNSVGTASSAAVCFPHDSPGGS